VLVSITERQNAFPMVPVGIQLVKYLVVCVFNVTATVYHVNHAVVVWSMALTEAGWVTESWELKS
jgi:hypothetical protein